MAVFEKKQTKEEMKKMGREEDYEHQEKDYEEMRGEFHRILDRHKVSKEDQEKLVTLSRHMD